VLKAVFLLPLELVELVEQDLMVEILQHHQVKPITCYSQHLQEAQQARQALQLVEMGAME
jgi:hypothetical protein